MSILWIVLLLVALQRLAELAYARRNTRLLRAEGAYEIGAGHYPFLVGLHVLWFAALALFVPAERAPDWLLLGVFAGLQGLRLWLLSLAVFVPAERAPDWLLLGVFLVLQGLRLWVLASLGRFWTTRIITLPGAPLVRRGPYRWLRHPNYLVVAGEIAVLPLAFGAWEIAVIFSLANAAVLWVRIRAEERALSTRTQAGSRTSPTISAPREAMK